jgi:hypothetical protein
MRRVVTANSLANTASLQPGLAYVLVPPHGVILDVLNV